MKKVLLPTIILLLVMVLFSKDMFFKKQTGAPPYTVEDLEPPSEEEEYAWINNWKRPDGPARVGLQVGHWKNSELPDELERLRGNTGSSGGGAAEWEVNLKIAQETEKILLAKGIQVDILPSTVPPLYWADVFIAIHADGSTDTSKSGFKVAAPRRDFSGGSDKLVGLIEKKYSEETKISLDPNVTRNMRGYYAFAWWRYTHAVHPRTTSVILETGFLTSAGDRRTIVARPEVSAQGLANAVIEFLNQEGLLTPKS